MVKKNKTGASVRKSKGLLYVIAGAFVLVLLYFSFDVIPLDEYQKAEEGKDLTALTSTYFKEILPEVLADAPEPCVLMDNLASAEAAAWEQYGKQTTIGSRYYFLTKGIGVVSAVDDDFVSLTFGGADQHCTLKVSTVYVFGNEIRDASGKLLLQDIGDLASFNGLAQSINTHARETILSPFLKDVQLGEKVQFAGAFVVNRKLGLTDDLEIKPIQLQRID